MKTLAAFVVLVAALAVAQTCPVPVPPAPPKADRAVIHFPKDGGHIGCTGYGLCDACKGEPTPVTLGNAKCLTARQIADQSVANDNGWNDGGTP